MRKQVKNNVSWIGYTDWELESFHGDDYSIENGSSQNAYLIEEEKIGIYNNYEAEVIPDITFYNFLDVIKKEV